MFTNVGTSVSHDWRIESSAEPSASPTSSYVTEKARLPGSPSSPLASVAVNVTASEVGETSASQTRLCRPWSRSVCRLFCFSGPSFLGIWYVTPAMVTSPASVRFADGPIVAP